MKTKLPTAGTPVDGTGKTINVRSRAVHDDIGVVRDAGSERIGACYTIRHVMAAH